MGLIIAAILLCILLILLLSSLKITLNICDGVEFKINFLGINIFNLKKKHKRKKQKNGKEDKKLIGVLKEYTKDKSRKKLVEEILYILKEICVKFGRLLKRIRFIKLDFDLTVASGDAATTAIRYGSICSVVYSICGMLESTYNFDAKKIKVTADFTSEQMKLELKSVIKVRLIHLINFALSSVFSIIKMKIGEVKNGRT